MTPGADTGNPPSTLEETDMTVTVQNHDLAQFPDGQPPAPDAERTPQPAPGRRASRPNRLGRALRALRTFVVLLALLAGAVLGGNYVLRDRLAAQAFVDIGDAVLTAEALPVGSASSGVVREILVADQDSVTANQPLVRVLLPAVGTGDDPRIETVRAPAAGRVSSVEATVGGVAGAGEPLVTLYDPSRLTFQVDVPVDELPELRLGMTARITGPGLPGGITATLDQVLPRVGSDPAGDENELTVVLIPDSAAMRTVPSLVPGLRFSATVDTKTAAGGTPVVNSA